MDIASSSKNDCYEIEVPLKLLQYLSSDNYNVHTLCRICLSERNSELIPLIATTNKLLQEMFTSITAIEVGTNDGLPKNVCDLCRTHIINCYEFKVLCEKSDCTLKSLIKGEFVTKEEKDATVRNETMQCNAEHIDDFEDIKREDLKDEVTDVQYLEGSSESDHEMLFIVQNSSDKDHVQIAETEITTTKDIISKESKRKKHKIHVCTFCDKKFTSTKAVKSHMKRAHSSTSNSCSQCKESYQSQHDLKLHIPVHGAGPIWTCIECNKEFKGRSMLKRHIQRHMETKRYACETCGKPFAELYALRRHARVHTGERVEKRHACHLCDNRYSSRSQLAAHVTRHGAARPFKCDTCGKAFCSARLLASHGLVHDDYKPHHCNYCDKRFRHESTRNTHHRTHTGEKPYVCTTCGKRFIQNSNLTLHMRTHTGERPYSCKTCGRSFSSGSTLKSHIRTHTGDKPYQCPVCGKRFARMDLRAHMRQHTGERPFECSLCGRRFATAARVRDHHRIHTGEKPFECAHCSTKYTTKAHLVKHVKRHNKRRRAMQARRQTNDQRYSQVKVVTPDREIIDDHTSTLSTTIDVTTIDPKDLIITTAHDDNEVSGEIILESEDTQSGSLCLTSEVNSDMNYSSDMNVLTVNDGGVHIASSAAEGATVKLYQVDQSLLQIHSAGGQVTISKITSKMTANF